MITETDKEYMRRALLLAVKGTGYTSPNPLVGAVIVNDGKVIGEGYHERYGELHAERNALKNCTDDPAGSTIYVTLEPCCHHGKQPPCTDAILEAGIKRVVIGSSDPNPLVAGKGVEILRSHGVEVETDVLRDECDAINKAFFHYITKKRPFVTMKYAMTLDGKIACKTGKSKWITSDDALRYVHSLRSRNMGIMAGIGTVLADDPMLDTRYDMGLSPVRIICDTDLRTPLSSKVVETAKRVSEDEGRYRDWLPKTLIATTVSNPERIKEYEDKGVKILTVNKDDSGRVDLTELMSMLGEMKIDTVFLEGGADMNWSMLSKGLVDHAYAFAAPKIFGGKDARSPVEGTGVDEPAEAFRLECLEIQKVGCDVLIEGDVINEINFMPQDSGGINATDDRDGKSSDDTKE